VSIPLTRWSRGSWNRLLPLFNRLAAMVDLDPNPSVEQLAGVIKTTLNAKLFAESIEKFIKATAGMSMEQVIAELREIEKELSLLGVMPFMSTEKGMVAPELFKGVGYLTTGTATYTDERLKQLLQTLKTGARILRVVCFASSRFCEAPADLKHPVIKAWKGLKPTEAEFQRKLVEECGLESLVDVKYADLPRQNAYGRPLSLQQQLEHFMESGQSVDLVGLAPIYVPTNFNALYVPLHVANVMGRDNIWLSQNGGTLVDELPKHWAPVQHTLTWPNGAFRLFEQLVRSGAIDYSLVEAA
jgi:hypothetical protein